MKTRATGSLLACLVAFMGYDVEPAEARREPCAQCELWYNGPGESYEHRFAIWGSLYTGPFHNDFVWETCEGGGHSPCEESFVKDGGFQRIEVLVAASDWHSLRELVDDKISVHYNASRNALQVEDCNHQVIAHFELPKVAADVLAGVE
jgi:hypothetical protein